MIPLGPTTTRPQADRPGGTPLTTGATTMRIANLFCRPTQPTSTDEMLAHRSARPLGRLSTVQDGEPVALQTPPSDLFHHQSYAGGLVKCRSCQQFTTCWSNHLRTHHIGMTTVMAADHLRDVATLVATDLSYGLDVVDRIMDAMDQCARLGVDDASEGLATLAVDVMLTHVTGSRITTTLWNLADDMAPLAHIG